MPRYRTQFFWEMLFLPLHILVVFLGLCLAFVLDFARYINNSFPLCNLESLLVLPPLSVMGVFAMLITTIFVGWRCLALTMSPPYATASSGALLQSLGAHQLPTFTTFCKSFGSRSSLILGGMAASAYLGHFSPPFLTFSSTWW